MRRCASIAAALVLVACAHQPMPAPNEPLLAASPGMSLSGHLTDPSENLTWVLGSGATAQGSGDVSAFLCKKTGADRCQSPGVTLIGREVPSGPHRIVITWRLLQTKDGCTMIFPRDNASAAAGQSCLARYHVRLRLPRTPTVIGD